MIKPPTKVETAQHGGYPLAMLFLLMAAVSVLLAMDAAVVESGTHNLPELLAGSVCGGGMSGAILGALMGLFHHRRTTGLLRGILTGIIVGPLLAPLLIVESAAFMPLLAVSLFGSGLLLTLAVSVRLNAARRPERRQLPWDAEQSIITTDAVNPPASATSTAPPRS